MIKRNTTYTKIKTIPEWVYKEAESRAEKLPIYFNSHRKEQANKIGCLGEVVAEEWMKRNKITFKSALEETTHDYLINDRLTIDVKTKDRTVAPRIDFDNSTPLYNHNHQKPNYFLFVSLQREKNKKGNDIRNYHTAYIVGAISYEELNKIGIIFYKNEVDPRNKTKFWTDCINIQMSQLISTKETSRIFRGEITYPITDAEPDIDLIKQLNKWRESSTSFLKTTASGR